MPRQPDIKYRPDGSIDTGYYMEIGRRMRAQQAHDMVKAALPRRAARRKPRRFAFLTAG